MIQRIVQRCTTCHQPIGGASKAETTEAVNLCGSEEYVVCPTCCQVVPQELRTAAYKAVWARKHCELAGSRPGRAVQAAVPAEAARQTVTPEEWLRERLEFEETVAKSREKRPD